MATVCFSFVVLTIVMSLVNLSPRKYFETCANSERRFIYHVVKDFVNEEDHALVLSWMKKWLAGTLVLAGNDLDIRSKSKRKQRSWKRTVKTGWYLFTLLILISGDIQMQPGPSTAAVNPTYPCGLCEKNVRSNQAALCCDICDTWNHRKCLDMPLSVYRRLGKGDEMK